MKPTMLGAPGEHAASRRAGPRFVVLGPLEVYDGENGRTPNAHKPRALLAILLVRANSVVPTQTLISEMWGDRPPRTALKALRVYISQLRRIFAGLTAAGRRPVIVTRDPGYRLEIDEEMLDMGRFERLCELAHEARDAGNQRDARRYYRDAAALWQGPALIDVRDSSPLLDAAALRMEELRISTLEQLLELEIHLGDHDEATLQLRLLAADYPLRERIHYNLMVALSASGRRGEALEVFREMRSTYVAELGLEPGYELQRLHRAILASDSVTLPSWDS